MSLPEGLVDDPIFDVIARLSDCLCTELVAANGPGLCYCGPWVGATAPPLGISQGCETGVAWVRLVSAYPSNVFPQPEDGTTSNCGTRMAYEVEIGVARPAPRPAGRDLFPDKQLLFEAQRLYASDMRASRRALLCCLPEVLQRARKPAVLVRLGQYTPLENAGGKSGGVWQGYIGFA